MYKKSTLLAVIILWSATTLFAKNLFHNPSKTNHLSVPKLSLIAKGDSGTQKPYIERNPSQLFAGMTIERIPQNSLFNSANAYGFHMQNKLFDFAFAGFEASAKDENSDNASGIMFRIGLTVGFDELSLGQRKYGIAGWLIHPTASLNYRYLNLNPSGSKALRGIGFSPGAQIQLPFFVADFRLNAAYFFGRDDNDPVHQAFKGFSIFPSVSFALDGMFDILAPESVQTGTQTNKRTSATSLGGGWYSVSTTYTSYDVYKSDIGTLFTLTPSLNIGGPENSGARLFGGAANIRYQMFAFDAMVHAGNLIYQQPQYAEAIFENGVPEIDLTGKFSHLNASIGAGVDPFRALGKIFFAKRSTKDNTTTGLIRFYMGMMAGYGINGNVKISNEARTFYDTHASQQDDYEETGQYDPQFFTSGINLSFYGMLEIGTISVGWRRMAFVDGFGNQMLTFGYMIPIKRVIKAYREKPWEIM